MGAAYPLAVPALVAAAAGVARGGAGRAAAAAEAAQNAVRAAGGDALGRQAAERLRESADVCATPPPSATRSVAA